jgi:hypothetical protein
MPVDSLSAHGILVTKLVPLAGSIQQFDIFLLLQHKKKTEILVTKLIKGEETHC